MHLTNSFTIVQTTQTTDVGGNCSSQKKPTDGQPLKQVHIQSEICQSRNTNP